MKFSIRKIALLQVIQTVSKAVAVRTTKQVLSGILLHVHDNSLVATAYDLELGIQATVLSDETTKLQVDQPGAIVLPARYFSDVIRKLPNDLVTIRVNNNYMTEIKSGTAEFHLHGIDAAEYPTLPLFIGAQAISVSSDMLRELIRTTAFASSNSEVRPILTGIHAEYKNQMLTFTATDALRLAKNSANLPIEQSGEWTVILPGKSLQELAKILPEDEQPVVVQFTESHSLFSMGQTLFYTRLIEGVYPDTKRLIPPDFKSEIALSLSDFLGAIDRASLIASRENYQVRLEIVGTDVLVTSSSAEIGNVSETLSCVHKAGVDIQIAFNGKFVLDALKALNDGDIEIRFNGGNQPFVIRQRGNELGLQLITPVLWR